MHDFQVGDVVRIMTLEEATAEYGTNEYGNILLPDCGSEGFDYRDLDSDVGGVVATIASIRDDGSFRLDVDDPRVADLLHSYYIDKLICVHPESETEIEAPNGLLVAISAVISPEVKDDNP